MLVTKTSSENIEHDSLPMHVELCAHRILAINKKIIELENSQTKMDAAISSLRFLVVKSIGAATGVISLVMSLTIIILDRLK